MATQSPFFSPIALSSEAMAYIFRMQSLVERLFQIPKFLIFKACGLLEFFSKCEIKSFTVSICLTLFIWFIYFKSTQTKTRLFELFSIIAYIYNIITCLLN